MVLTLSIGHAAEREDCSELPALLSERRIALERLSELEIDPVTRQALEEVQRHEQVALEKLMAFNARLADHLVQAFEERRAAKLYRPSGPSAQLDQTG